MRYAILSLALLSAPAGATVPEDFGPDAVRESFGELEPPGDCCSAPQIWQTGPVTLGTGLALSTSATVVEGDAHEDPYWGPPDSGDKFLYERSLTFDLPWAVSKVGVMAQASFRGESYAEIHLHGYDPAGNLVGVAALVDSASLDGWVFLGMDAIPLYREGPTDIITRIVVSGTTLCAVDLVMFPDQTTPVRSTTWGRLKARY